jgi:uncharacterized protein YodC (DUF2158 family)
MPKHRLGDIVHLKSGGPAMTVDAIKTEPYTIYHCTWFDGEGKYNSCDFDCHELTETRAGIGFGRKNCDQA